MEIGLCTQSEVKNAMLCGNLFAVFEVAGGIERGPKECSNEAGKQFAMADVLRGRFVACSESIRS